ncbi:choice-of-anchor H family protein [Alteromonas lipotrueae]|uniref:choice-of-anchor H family protein n=1 Tax=Alteromonas lipotrueae TaxID=2803814 RepID=UPI001C4518FE|nr:choice-of-anchor H family protein [Alteromonas lipotrueae]
MKSPIQPFAKFCLLAVLPCSLITTSYADPVSSNDPVSVESTEYRYGAVYSPAEASTKAAINATTKNASTSAINDTKTGVLESPSLAEKKAKRESLFSGTSKSYAEAQSTTLLPDYWIYDSWVSLDTDIDYDGYYSEFTVEFDADTAYDSALVYGVIYLGRNDRYEAIHVTSEFVLYGEDSSDAFVVESRLLSGFPAADYDVLIELYDAYSEQLVAFSDGYDDADLAYLSLESDNHEYIYEDTVIVVEEHGGSTTIFGLLFIAFTLVARRLARH